MLPDYSYSCAEIRAREARLLDADALQGGEGTADMVRRLADLGYGQGGQGSVEALIEAEMASVAELIKTMLPRELYSLLLLENDCHNMKVLLKAAVVGKKFPELIKNGSVFDPQIAEACAQGGEFSLLSEHIASVLNPAYDGGELVSPYGISTSCDRAFYGELAICAKKAPDIIKRACALEADCINYLSYKRARAVNMDQSSFRMALIPGGSLSCERLYEAYCQGSDDLGELSFGCDCHFAYLNAEKSEGGTLGETRLALSLEVQKIYEEGRYDTDTPVPIFLYYKKKQNEALKLRALAAHGRNEVQ